MSHWRCNCCGGTYRDIGADGAPYFHACAPVLDPDSGTWVLPPGGRDENPRPGMSLLTHPGQIIVGIDKTGELVLLDDGAVPIRSEGLGRTLLHP